MSHASLVACWCLLGAALVLGGCACVPNSFRIKAAENLHDRILFPPGAVISHDELDLYVETQTLRCQNALPTRTFESVTVSNPYWPAVGSRVLRIEVALNATNAKLTQIPPAECLNVAVRPAPIGIECPQDLIFDKVWSAIEKETDWLSCFPEEIRTKEGEHKKATAGKQISAEISQVLPHRASESGALREERTYARNPEPARRVSALAASSPPTVAPLDTEVVGLLPGATVCVNRDYILGKDNPWTWVSSAQSCVRLLEAPIGRGSVVLSRTDTEYTFPFARDFYGKDEAKIYEARSWLAVRGMLAALMPQGAFLYLYYSGTHDAPQEGHWEPRETNSLRVYPTGDVGVPIPISPVLVAHSQPLVLERSAVPNLTALCEADKVNTTRVERRCFAFRDFTSIDVLWPFSVDGRVYYVPSGTLTTDIPEIAASRRPVSTRIFHGRRAPLDFDVSNPQNAVPLAPGDQFGGRQ